MAGSGMSEKQDYEIDDDGNIIYPPLAFGFDTKPSVQEIPARWSLTVGIDSIDWFTIMWYRWYFSKADGLMVSKTIEWNLRKFWKVNIEP
jgi:hypothetical protein